MTYDLINSFILNKNEYLFFDIFHKNNEIVLICPVYSETYPNFNNIKIKNSNKYLKLKKSVKKIKREPIVILIYELKNNGPITVSYNGITKKYTLSHIYSKINIKLSQTTLMKNDYKLINVFYDYYRKQGVQYFYIYYNGKLTDTIKNKYKKKNIKLIEWDYAYWNNKRYKFNHHAQLGQIHHALYKYGKKSSEYMIFNDLDEYMYSNKKLINLISSKKDTYGFLNYWSNTLNDEIPKVLPSKIKIGNQHKYGKRSKCIHKTDSINCIGIHKEYNYNIRNPRINKNSGMLLHFYNWTRAKRIHKTNKIFNLNIIKLVIIKNCKNKNCNGIYKLISKDTYQKDENHHLYKWQNIWRLGNKGVKVYYILNKIKNWETRVYDMNLE